MKYYLMLFFSFAVVLNLNAQTNTDDGVRSGTFNKLSEALKNPKKVKRLDLTGQEVRLTDDVLKRFTNLEFLSLKDDHLSEVPHGIVYLSKLKVLDLSGNYIKELPEYIGKLKSLEEVYLNNESNLDLEQSIGVLNVLPNLRTLHLENDHLRFFPKNIVELKNLEKLYLTNNDIKELPRDIKLPKNLKLIDMKLNKLGAEIDKENRFGKGIIIEF